MVNQDPGKTLALIRTKANSPFLVISEWVAMVVIGGVGISKVAAPTRDPRVPIRQSRSGARTAHIAYNAHNNNNAKYIKHNKHNVRKLQLDAREVHVVAYDVRARFGVGASTPSDAGETLCPRTLSAPGTADI